LGTQLQFQFVIGFFETFLVVGKFKGFLTSHHAQDFDTFCLSYDVFVFFLLNEGMLLAFAMTAKSARNCQILPKFAQGQSARRTLKCHQKLRSFSKKSLT
jgi:hypothetical protein